jgi:P-type Cu2+ transporter
MVTGESRPVPKREGARVVVGTVVTDSALRVPVDAVGEETALAGIRRLVEQAQTSHSRAQALADRRPRCCSTSRWAPASSPWRCGWP